MGWRFFIVVAMFVHYASQLILANDEESFSASANARYACGIRKRFGAQIDNNSKKSELGQWPWHTALFYNNSYICGGTLIDQQHVLTAAGCIPANFKINGARMFRIYLGLNVLDEYSEQVQMRNVEEIYKKPMFGIHHNDIALLKLNEAVKFSEFIIPICLVGSQIAKLEDMVNKRGWIVGWEISESKILSKQLKTAQMLAVDYTMCNQFNQTMYLQFVSPAMFCASHPINDTVCFGYGGGGMYFLAGDRWELRGILSFAGATVDGTCDPEKYMGLTSVPFFFEWIKRITVGTFTRENIKPKRISERKCREYQQSAINKNGVCLNYNSPHTVAIIDPNERHILSGSIISEKFVLSKAPNLEDIFELDVDWDEWMVRVGKLLNINILRNFLHPQFEAETYRNHIMLLELKKPLIFTSGLLPACLANEETKNLLDDLLLSGYTGQNLNIYERNDSKVITSESCNSSVQSINWKYSINEEELCTVFQREENFSLSGIVGGALQTFNTRGCMYTIVGITKMIIQKDEDKVKYIGVFSPVVTYLDWIEEVVWGKTIVPEDTSKSSDAALGANRQESYRIFRK